MGAVPPEGPHALTDPTARDRATRFADALLSVVDPGNPRFLRRWAKMGAAAAAVVSAAAILGLLVIAQTPFGRYMRAVVDITYLHRYEQAASSMRRLIQERPGERYAVYATLATALAEQDRLDEALDVMNQAVKLFPADERAHTKRCRIGTSAGHAGDVESSCAIAAEVSARRRKE